MTDVYFVSLERSVVRGSVIIICRSWRFFLVAEEDLLWGWMENKE